LAPEPQLVSAVLISRKPYAPLRSPGRAGRGRG
jgi:hypothetical protein